MSLMKSKEKKIICPQCGESMTRRSKLCWNCFVKTMQRPIEYKITKNDCWEVISHSKTFYGYIVFKRNRKRIWAHRYIYEKFFGPIPDNLCVCHKCDNRSCINPAHLFLETYQDNITDKMIKGRHRVTFGENHYRTKLTESQVIEIKKSNFPINKIAEIYHVSRSCISHIRGGRSWKHIEV